MNNRLLLCWSIGLMLASGSFNQALAQDQEIEEARPVKIEETPSGTVEAASADTKKTEQKKEEIKPKSGVLSATHVGGHGATALPINSDPKLDEEESAPITGSVSRQGQGAWVMKVMNNTAEDTYSVSVRVVQKNNRGGQLKSDFFSLTLPPKQSEQRSLKGPSSAATAELVLESWRKLGSGKKGS